MIADISPAIDSLFMKDYTYQVYSQTELDGEFTEVLSDTSSIRCAVLPMNGKELKTFPEGQYTMEDKIILTHASTTLKEKDRVIANSISYEILNELDVSDIVRIKKYIGRKI